MPSSIGRLRRNKSRNGRPTIRSEVIRLSRENPDLSVVEACRLAGSRNPEEYARALYADEQAMEEIRGYRQAPRVEEQRWNPWRFPYK